MSSEMKDEEKNIIINALKVLKQTCLSFQGLDTDFPDTNKCEDCPLGYGWGGCQLTECYPFKYDINDSDEPWRALI